ncbi:MAG: polysaccharide biosynthesis protein [Anaerolineales bacterium]
MRRTGGYVAADALIIVLAYRVALPLRFAGLAGEPNSFSPDVMAYWVDNWRMFVPWIVIVHVVANALSGVYSRLWRFASAPDVLIVVQAWIAASILLLGVDYLWAAPIRLLPLTTVAMGSFMSMAGFTVLRYRSRLLASAMYRLRRALNRRDSAVRPAVRVLIVGAGEAGQTLSWQLQNRKRGEHYNIIGFVDDDPGKQGLNVHGSPVLGSSDQIPELVASHGVDLIVIAIQAITGQQFREMLQKCQRTSAQIKIAPDVFASLQEQPHGPLVRDVTVQDFLGRSSTTIDMEACRSILQDRVVLVTGGAGSIGSELCRQVLDFAPASVVALDINETGLYELQMELRFQKRDGNFNAHVVDVTDADELQRIFDTYRPQVVFHAAAYKHVPLMEVHPRAAFNTNVLGTLRVGHAAAAVGAERLVGISTDKSVNPVSVMGATKRLAECICVALAGASDHTLFTAVRFGNVLASRGSVVPLFERQIDFGGPVTVTHPDMTRYFMTLPEAVRLVIQAAALTQGGDLFMLDMGERIRIVDLAERMIRLRGLRPEVDIKIEFSGLRPGEKLHEELLGPAERREPTPHPHIYRVLSTDNSMLTDSLSEIEGWLDANADVSRVNVGRRLVEYARSL